MTQQQPHAPVNKGGSLLESGHVVHTRVRFARSATVFAQGDRCDGVMYLARGRVQLSVVSPQGSTAVVGLLDPGVLFGEGALAGQRHRLCSADAVTACTVILVKTAEMRRQLRRDIGLSDWLRSQMLARNVRLEEDIVTQILNGSEKRLARALLLLADFDQHQLPQHALPIVSRDVLADMTGTPRATVDRLMASFRKRGFLERRTLRDGGVQIHRSLMSVVLQ